MRKIQMNRICTGNGGADYTGKNIQPKTLSARPKGSHPFKVLELITTYLIFHDRKSQKKNTGGKTQSRLPEYFLDAFGWRTKDVEKLC